VNIGAPRLGSAQPEIKGNQGKLWARSTPAQSILDLGKIGPVAILNSLRDAKVAHSTSRPGPLAGNANLVERVADAPPIQPMSLFRESFRCNLAFDRREVLKNAGSRECVSVSRDIGELVFGLNHYGSPLLSAYRATLKHIGLFIVWRRLDRQRGAVAARRSLARYQLRDAARRRTPFRCVAGAPAGPAVKMAIFDRRKGCTKKSRTTTKI
jgi:hypothetical protein